MPYFRSATFLTGAVTGILLGMAAEAADRAEPPATPAGYVRTGETTNCLVNTRIRSSRILNRDQILFEMQGGKTYLTEPKNCRLRKSHALSYKLTSNQLCTTTIVHLIETGSSTSHQGACILAPFERLEKKTAAAD